MSDAEWLKETIAPKSDQINADDLITGPMTVTVKGWKRGSEPAQPIDIQLAECKPYRPCKSMRRVLVSMWGADPNEWIGRKMTLFCEPSVMFGGLKVGGIRISHMSDISERGADLQLTATRGKRANFRVELLKSSKPVEQTDPISAQIKFIIDTIKAHVATADERREVYAAWNITDPRKPEQWTDETLAAATEFAQSLEAN